MKTAFRVLNTAFQKPMDYLFSVEIRDMGFLRLDQGIDFRAMI